MYTVSHLGLCEAAVSWNTGVSAPGRLLTYSMNGEIIPCLMCARYKGGSAAGRGRYGRFHCVWYICVWRGYEDVPVCVGGV